MLDQDLLTKFWKDFRLTTQDEDLEFPVTNPQDAARVLVKCRNWVGTFTEMLIETESKRTKLLRAINSTQRSLENIEECCLAEALKQHSATVLKSKDFQAVFISEYLNKGDEQTRHYYYTSVANIRDAEIELVELDSDKAMLENIVKRLEKSTDWLAQYLNWSKFELRMLQ